MVENVAGDGIEPKPAKIESSGIGVGSGVTSGDVEPNVGIKFKVKIPFQAHISHIEEKSKPVPTVTLKKNLNRYLPVFVVLK